MNREYRYYREGIFGEPEYDEALGRIVDLIGEAADAIQHASEIAYDQGFTILDASLERALRGINDVDPLDATKL